MPAVYDTSPRSREQKVLYLGQVAAGNTVVVRPISKALKQCKFLYPAYKPDFKKQGGMIDGYAQFNMTAELSDQVVIRSNAENAMLELFYYELENVKKRIEALTKKTYTPGRNPFQIDNWGPTFGQRDYAQFGMCTVERGNVTILDMYRPHYNALYSAMRAVKDGKLIYTPLTCSLEITMQTQEGKKTLKPIVQVIESQEGCMNFLPAQFIGCAWVHPEDFQMVQEFVQKTIEAMTWGKEMPEAPIYRDYPSDDGKLYFVATQSIQTPLWVNVFEKGFPENLLPKLKDRGELWQYMPATEHSLKGGPFYNGDDGLRKPLTLDEIKKNFVRVEEGKAIISIDGIERVVEWIKGSLYDKKFNPFLVDTNQGRSVFNSPDDLAKKAQSLGIPVKGDTDPKPIVDWSAYFGQANVKPSTDSPISTL